MFWMPRLDALRKHIPTYILTRQNIRMVISNKNPPKILLMIFIKKVIFVFDGDWNYGVVSGTEAPR